MTDEQLAEIKARAEAASPAPWLVSYSTVFCNKPWPDVMGNVYNDTDAAFIAHARTDVPALVAEVERLRAQLGEEQRKGRQLEQDLQVARERLALGVGFTGLIGFLLTAGAAMEGM